MHGNSVSYMFNNLSAVLRGSIVIICSVTNALSRSSDQVGSYIIYVLPLGASSGVKSSTNTAQIKRKL